MGRRRRKHKNNHKKQQPQAQNCNHKNCNGQCKPEDKAEIVEIETPAELQKLLDIIMQHGADRTARWQLKQKELENALLEDAGIPISIEKPADIVTSVADDSAI